MSDSTVCLGFTIQCPEPASHIKKQCFQMLTLFLSFETYPCFSFKQSFLIKEEREKMYSQPFLADQIIQLAAAFVEKWVMLKIFLCFRAQTETWKISCTHPKNKQQWPCLRITDSTLLKPFYALLLFTHCYQNGSTSLEECYPACVCVSVFCVFYSNVQAVAW